MTEVNQITQNEYPTKAFISALFDFSVLINDKPIYADAINKFANDHKYATIKTIVKFLNPILRECGLVMRNKKDFYETKNGEIIWYLETTLTHMDSGQCDFSRFPIEGKTAQDKIGFVTYGRRSNITEMLNLVFDEDDDGNNISGVGSAAKDRQKATSKKFKTYIELVSEVRELKDLKALDKWAGDNKADINNLKTMNEKDYKLMIQTLTDKKEGFNKVKVPGKPSGDTMF